MFQHASHTYTFFTKQQEQGQSEGVDTWFLLICKAWQMDICKLSIKISGTSDRSHPTRWSYVILRSNDLRISSQLILCLALLTVSTLHLQAGLSLKPTPHFLSHYRWGSTRRLTFSLYQSHWPPGGLSSFVSYTHCEKALWYATQFQALFLSLSCLTQMSPSPLEWEDEPGEEQGSGRGTDCTAIHPKHKKNTMLAWEKCYSVHPKKKMPMMCGANDPSEKPLTRKKPQGGKQTKV